MSGGSREQVTRLLALAPYLQKRGDVALQEVAADFGITPAQVLKDLRVLYLCGLPGYGPGDLIDINVEALEDDPDGLVRVDNADFLARPLRLGSNEASALIVALHALLDASPAGSRDVVERTLGKLEEAAAAGSPPLVGVHLPRSGPAVDGTATESVLLQPGQEVTLGRTVTATFHALADDQPPPSSTDLAGHDKFRAALEAEVVRARFFGRRLSVLLLRAIGPQPAHVRFWATRVQAMLRPVDRLVLSVNASNVFNKTAIMEVSATEVPTGGVAGVRTLYGRLISTSARFFF